MRTFFLGLFFATTAMADESVFALDTAVTLALQNNGLIQAGADQVEAARERIPQAKALEDPEFGVQVYQMPTRSFAVDQAQEYWYFASQKFPLFGKRKARGKVAMAEAKMSEEALRARKLEVQTEVEHSFHTAFLLEKRLQIVGDSVRALTAYKKSALAQYASKTAMLDDPIKASLEITTLEDERLQIERDLSIAQAKLNRLMGRDPMLPIRVKYSMSTMQLNMPETALVSAAQEHNPMLRGTHYEVERGRASTTLAKRQLLPDVTLQAMFMKNNYTNNMMSYQAVVNLPIWGKQIHGVKEAKAQLRAAENARDNAAYSVTEEVRSQYADYVRAKKSIQLYRSAALSQAKLAVDSARRGFESGASSFLNLMDAWKRYKEMQDRYWTSFVDAERAVTHLGYLVGYSLRHPQGENP